MVNQVYSWIQANSATIKDIAISVSQAVLFALTLYFTIKSKYKQIQSAEIKTASDIEMKKCQEQMYKENQELLNNYMLKFKAESEKNIKLLQSRQEKIALDTKMEIDSKTIKVNKELQTLYKIKGESADENITI